MHETAILPLDELANLVSSDSSISIPPDYSFVSMAVTRALIRQNKTKLYLLSVPQSGIQTDMLVGAGCVSEIETAAVSLGEFGSAHQVNAALKAGILTIINSTCPAIHAGLQASEKGLPFLPLRGLIGTDLLRTRPDWIQAENPLSKNDPIVFLPAIKTDFAIFHAPFADREGNVWIGRRRELATMSHAAEQTLVTVEEIRETNIMSDELTACGALSAMYVTAIAEVPNGAWPLGLSTIYPPDFSHLELYSKMARKRESFKQYLNEYVL